MANEEPIQVSIIPDSHGSAHYIYFIRYDSENHIDDWKCFLIDGNEYNKQFPNLIAHKWFLLDDVNLNTKSKTEPNLKLTYIGMKGSSNEGSILSVIYPLELIKNNYLYAYITDDTVTSAEEINNDNPNYLYKLVCQQLNQYKSYIIDLLSYNDSDLVSLTDIIIAYHEVDKSAHVNDISIFASDRSSNSLISKLLWKYNNELDFIKMNGIVSVKPYSNRIKFYGTPITYDTELYFCNKIQFDTDTKRNIQDVLDYAVDIYKNHKEIIGD